MICLFGFTLNIAQAFETTWTQLVSFYVSTDFMPSALQISSCANWVLPVAEGLKGCDPVVVSAAIKFLAA